MSPTEIKDILDIATGAFVAIIILFAIISGGYIKKQNENKELIQKRRWIESLPSMVSTLGVLGTFGGITLGLWFFNTKELNDSIPLLLSGLKTAFFTSLAGMIGSLVLNRMVSRLYDEQDGGVSDINQAAALITKAMVEMKNESASNLVAIKDVLIMELNQQEQMKNLVSQQFDTIVAQSSRIKSIDENLKSLMVSFGNMEDSLTAMKSTEQSVNDKFTSLTDTIGDIATATESSSQA